eukprot:1158667-Rhodomonas_salina.2
MSGTGLSRQHVCSFCCPPHHLKLLGLLVTSASQADECFDFGFCFPLSRCCQIFRPLADHLMFVGDTYKAADWQLGAYAMIWQSFACLLIRAPKRPFQLSKPTVPKLTSHHP